MYNWRILDTNNIPKAGMQRTHWQSLQEMGPLGPPSWASAWDRGGCISELPVSSLSLLRERKVARADGCLHLLWGILPLLTNPLLQHLWLFKQFLPLKATQLLTSDAAEGNSLRKLASSLSCIWMAGKQLLDYIIPLLLLDKAFFFFFLSGHKHK